MAIGTECTGQVWQDVRWSSSPWPHLTAEPFSPVDVRCAALEVTALPDDAFTWYRTPRTHKGAVRDIHGIGPAVSDLWNTMTGDDFVDQLRSATGIDDLRSDPGATFAGVFVTPAGGWQRVHEDFTRHPGSGLWHRAVVLLYLSDWQPGNGGELELWDRAMAGPPSVVEPTAGRMVAFTSSSATLHGVRQVHRDAGSRVAISARYYSATPPEEAPRHPAFRTVRRPGERRRDVRPSVQEFIDFFAGRGSSRQLTFQRGLRPAPEPGGSLVLPPSLVAGR